MKLDKEQQKHFAEAIRNASKKKGFKVKGCSIYVLEGNAFIHCDYFVDSQKMFYRIYIKNYEYVPVNNSMLAKAEIPFLIFERNRGKCFIEMY
mgnify:CR=1 FL=1